MSKEGEDDDFGDFVDSSFTAEPAASTAPQPSSDEPFPVQNLAVNDPFGAIHEAVVGPQSDSLNSEDKVISEDDDWDNFASAAPAVSTNTVVEPVVVEPAVEPVEEETTPALDLEPTFTSTPTLEEPAPSTDTSITPSVAASNEALSDPFDRLTTEEASLPVNNVNPVVTEVEVFPSKTDNEVEAEETVDTAPVLEPSRAEEPSTPIDDTTLVAAEDISINNDSSAKKEASDPFVFLTIEDPAPVPVMESVAVLDAEDPFADLSAANEQPQVVTADIELQGEPIAVIEPDVVPAPTPAVADEIPIIDAVEDDKEDSAQVEAVPLTTEESSDPFDSIATSEEPVAAVPEEAGPVDVAPTPVVESNEAEDASPAQTESSAVQEAADPFDCLTAEAEAAPIPIGVDPVEAIVAPAEAEEVESSTVKPSASPALDVQVITAEDNSAASNGAEDPFHSLGTEDVQLMQVSANDEVPAQLDPFTELKAEPSLLAEGPVTTIEESSAAESVTVVEEKNHADASHETISAPASEVEVEVEVEVETQVETSVVETSEIVQEESAESVVIVDEEKAVEDSSDPFDHFDAVSAPETATVTITEEVQHEEDPWDNFETATTPAAVVSSPVPEVAEESLVLAESEVVAVVDEVHVAEQPLEEKEEVAIVDDFEAAFESATPVEVSIEAQDLSVVQETEDPSVEMETVTTANRDVDQVEITEEEEDDDWDTFASASPVPVEVHEIENNTEEVSSASIVPLAAVETTQTSLVDEAAINQEDVTDNAFGDDEDDWDAFEAAPAVVEQAEVVPSAVPEERNVAFVEQAKEPATSEFGEDNDWDAFESAPAQPSDTVAEVPTSSAEAFGDNDGGDDEWDAFEAAVPAEVPVVAAAAVTTTASAAAEGGDEWDAFHGPGEDTAPTTTPAAVSTVPSSSGSVVVALTGNQPIDQEMAALQTLLGVNINTDFMSKLASLKALTSSLYQVDKEAMASPAQHNGSSEVNIDWLDTTLSSPESPSTLTSWKATCNGAHITVVRQILVENIPPNACSLEQLQNELDSESKKYVVKTAEMKHRRVSSSESMMQDALSSLKTSSSVNNFSEESDSEWNVRATSSPSSPVPPARQEDRPPNNNTNNNNNANNNNNNANDFSKAAADFLRSLPNLAYILQ